MLGDIIGEIIGEIIVGKTMSERFQAAFRVFFGLAGTLLMIVGVYHTAFYDAGLAFRLGGMFLFFAIACFCFFNIALARVWKWPWKMSIISLPLLFLVRIIFGA